MSYEFPAPNKGQVPKEEPPELLQNTYESLEHALDFIHIEVKGHKGLKVLAADDKRWHRVGWLLKYPSGVTSYVCIRLSVTKGIPGAEIFRYEALRNSLAYFLEGGLDPKAAIERVQLLPFNGEMSDLERINATIFSQRNKAQA